MQLRKRHLAAVGALAFAYGVLVGAAVAVIGERLQAAERTRENIHRVAAGL